MNWENIWQTILGWLMTNGLKIVLILVIAYIAHLIFKKLIVKLVEKLVVVRAGEDASAEEKREKTLIKIIHGTVHVILIVVVILMILSEVGVNIGPLIAGAGVIGIAVGFGGQYLVRDVITGLFIILENQYRVGDGVEIAGLAGTVEDITLRKTVLRDLDGVVHHIPNGEIQTVSNKTLGTSKINLDIGVGYDTDINKLRDIINEVGQKIYEDEEFKDDLIEAPQFLRVNELGDSAVIVKIIGEVRPGTQWTLSGELRKRLLEKFREEGIDIPFPQMVIHKK
jgi:small-conductance mechanosensitive channel